MTQAEFTLLDAGIISASKHMDIHLVRILAMLALGLAQAQSLTASAALTGLAVRVGGF